MAKNSIRDYSATVGENTDIQSVNIDEGCSPAGINNAIREMMVDLANVNSGSVSLVSPDFDAATVNGTAIDAFPSGTKMLFNQTSAPTGWTKDTTHNDKALRITNGTVGTGGTNSFSTSFASYTPAGTNIVTIAGHALSISEMPSHKHSNVYVSVYQGNDDCAWTNDTDGMIGGNSINRGRRTSNLNDGLGSEIEGMKTSNTGGGTEHTHSGSTSVFTGTESTQFAVQYVDVIIASKD